MLCYDPSLTVVGPPSPWGRRGVPAAIGPAFLIGVRPRTPSTPRPEPDFVDACSRSSTVLLLPQPETTTA